MSASDSYSLRQALSEEIQSAMGPAELTERFVEDTEDRFGMRQRIASEDALRNFCNGIGNANPFYRGTGDGHPNFLHAIAFQGGLQRKPLVNVSGGLYGGSYTEWYRRIRKNDEFRVFTEAGQVKDISREDSLQFISPVYTHYHNQRDERVATITSTAIFFGGKKTSRPARVRRAPEPRKFSAEEIEDWYQRMLAEPVRGAEPRYWEDVAVGDELPPTHNVYTSAQTVSFFSGCGWVQDWRWRMLEYKTSLPGAFAFEPHPVTGIPELNDPWWHVFDGVAGRVGYDRAFCTGRLLECWLGTLPTNWMGDSGFLHSMDIRFRSLIYNGSLVLCRGQVIDKTENEGRKLVHLNLSMEDHTGVMAVSDAKAVVELPSRQGA